MSWPQWQAASAAGSMPGMQPPLPTTTTPNVTASAGVTAAGVPVQYTAEQWQQMQQQNWQQWAQWQQQYQQWQQQYGAEYQKLAAMSAGIMPAYPGTKPVMVPAPPTTVPVVQPPLPTQPVPPTAPQPPLPNTTQPPPLMSQYVPKPPMPTASQPQLTQPVKQNAVWPGAQPNMSQPPPNYNTTKPPAETKAAPKSLTLEELTETENKFMKQFAEWEAQFNKWKEQNQDHPDKAQYKEYEKKWEAWRSQLLERREQMRKKRLALIAAKNAAVSSTSTQPSGVPPQITAPQSNFKMNIKLNLSQKPALSTKPQEDDVQIIEPDSEPTTSLFPSASGGIPGLDLVDTKESESTTDKPAVPGISGLDLDALSKNINNILGDKKLLSMLSMVTQNTAPQAQNNFTSQPQSNVLPPETEEMSRSSYGAGIEDDRTQNSWSGANNWEETNHGWGRDGESNSKRPRFNHEDNYANYEDNNYNRFDPGSDSFNSQYGRNSFEATDANSGYHDGDHDNAGRRKNRKSRFGAASDDNLYDSRNSGYEGAGNYGGHDNRFSGPGNNSLNSPGNSRFDGPGLNSYNVPQGNNFSGQDNNNYGGPGNRFDGPGPNNAPGNNGFGIRTDNRPGPVQIHGPGNSFHGSAGNRYEHTNRKFEAPDDGSGNNRFDGPGSNRFDGPENNRFTNRFESDNSSRCDGPGNNRPGNNRFDNFGKGSFDGSEKGPNLDTLPNNSRFDNSFERPSSSQSRYDEAPPPPRFEPPVSPSSKIFDSMVDVLHIDKVIDYDHKPLKQNTFEVKLVAPFSFDYRHKPANRIPLPDRPKWLSETLKDIPQFEPCIGRQATRYPPADRYAYRGPPLDYEYRRVPPVRTVDYYEKTAQIRDAFYPESYSRRDDRRIEDLRRDSEYLKRDDTYSRRDEKVSRWEESSLKRDSIPRRTDNIYNDKDDSRYKRDDNRYGKEDFRPKCTDKYDRDDKPKFGDIKKTDAPVPNTVNKGRSLEDILNNPGRQKRPPRIVIILRGPPGSGKTFLAKIIKDKEVEHGGSAPRILSLDDYFMVEHEKEVVEEGKTIEVKEMVYEYEEAMEDSYRNALLKSFKKTITDGYFSFIIVDNVNDKLKHFEEMWSFGKQNGFQVFIVQLELDLQVCTMRNTHQRSEEDIKKLIDNWEPVPKHYEALDPTNLIQAASIPEVEMEEINSPNEDFGDDDDDVEMEDDDKACNSSKWDNFECSVDNLAKLDGTSKPLRPTGTMEDYLQLEDEWEPPKPAKPGKKRVRWADLEERREQEKMRAIGFVVGQTNWDRMMDPTNGESALTQTKYIEKVQRPRHF